MTMITVTVQPQSLIGKYVSKQTSSVVFIGEPRLSSLMTTSQKISSSSYIIIIH